MRRLFKKRTSVSKVSEMLMDVAREYIALGEDIEEKQQLLNGAASAWNIACLAKKERERSMKKYMPLTWIFMLIAALCLMGLPPLVGFWSKDSILLSSLEAHSIPIFSLALITVVLTSFYTIRFVGMVFYGTESAHLEHVKQEGGHLHEADRTMWGACGVLAIMVVLLGWKWSSLTNQLWSELFPIGTCRLIVNDRARFQQYFVLPLVLCGKRAGGTGNSVPRHSVAVLEPV